MSNVSSTRIESRLKELAPEANDHQLRDMTRFAMQRYGAGDSLDNAARAAVKQLDQEVRRGARQHGRNAVRRGY